MRLIMRRRSALVAIDSSSLRADLFIRTLYLATPFQVLDDVFERIVRFLFPNFEGLDIAGVFRQCGLDSVVDELGNAAISCSRFETKRTVKERIEVDGSSFLGGFTHVERLAL
jgi:hypothetical protein